MFRELKRQINGNLLPGQEGYIPVVNWQQSAGGPFRDAEAEPSSETEAAAPPSVLISPEECATGDLTFQRMKEMPEYLGFRYLGWSSCLELGEALPYFNQPGIADDLVLSRIDPVLREIGFFHLLRSRSINRNSELRSTFMLRPDRPPSPRNPLFPPVPPPPPVPAPPLGIPELQLTHLQPFVLFCDFTPPFLPTIFEGPARTWLFLINHTSVTLGPGHLPLLFPTIPAAIGGIPLFAWEEMAWRDGTMRPVLNTFGVPVRMYIDSYHRAQQLVLNRWQIRIFRLTGV